MINAKSLLDQFIGQLDPSMQQGQGQTGRPAGSGVPDLGQLLQGKGGLATGALAGGLAGILMGGGKPKKLAKNAIKLGGLALVGGLAYKAYRDWQANSSPAASRTDAPLLPAPQDSPFMPNTEAEAEEMSRKLMRAMISAAKADGHISDEERGRIAGQLDAMELSPDDRAFIQGELATPIDVAAVTKDVRSPEEAAEIYAASLLAIDHAGAAEKGYLAMLAARLGLDSKLVEHLHAAADGITDQARV